MSDLTSRIRPELARTSPYRWQEGIPDGPVDRFDMNTPADPPAWYSSAIAKLAAISPNDYPDASYLPLKLAIAGYLGRDSAEIVVGAGCDEIIGLCAQLALGRGDRAVVPRPTYGLYAIASANAGAEVVAIPPLRGCELDWAAALTAAGDARLVWTCSPNNPTGECADPAVIEQLCVRCPGLVVVDQAYLELGGDDLSRLIDAHDNLIIARTFSKGWALGAARVGYAIAQPQLAGALDALRPPGSLSSWSAAVAELACSEVEEMAGRCRAIVAERLRLAQGMRAAGVEVLADEGNFVLARGPVDDTFAELAARACVVRILPDPALAGLFRTTVAAPAANDRLLRALAELAGGTAPAESPPLSARRGEVHRRTRETSIDLRLGLGGSGSSSITTGLGFLDHMLGALAFWSLCDLDLRCHGDLWVDPHHTIEDCAIALGEAFDQALGDRSGLRRFGSAKAPLDEALAEATVDLSGRGIADLNLNLTSSLIGQVPGSLIPHFFDTFARRGRLGLHLAATGEDAHHIAEAAFKATALALRQAIELDPDRAGVASTKGVL